MLGLLLVREVPMPSVWETIWVAAVQSLVGLLVFFGSIGIAIGIWWLIDKVRYGK